MAVNWGLLNVPDIGGNMLAAIEQGKERRQQQEQQNALAAYAMNPTEGALGGLAQVNPMLAIQERGRFAEQRREAMKQRVETVARVAAMADTPEKWDAGVDFLVKQGYGDLAEYKGRFSPELRASAVAAGGDVEAFLKRMEPKVLGPGSLLVDPTNGRTISSAPFAPRTVTVSEGQTAVEYAPGTPGGFTGGFDAFHKNWLAPTEGGYVASDGRSGAPANFGVNQKANPDVDVANLTPEAAAQIMHDRYWVASGADRIEDPRLQAIHADTAVNMGVNAAQGLLQRSGGDPAAYLQMREQRYRQIGGPELNGWLNRNAKLAQFVGLGPAGGRVIAQGAPKPAAPQWQTMTPEQVKQAGLPAGVYQRSPTGEIKPVAGTTGKGAAQSQDAYSASAMDAFDRAISSASRLLKHGGLTAAVGVPSINPLDGNLAGFIVPGSPAADFRAELEALKAQVFLPMVQSMKGMGALSNAEGDKLTTSIGALDPKMSEGAFKASLNRIIGDLNSYKSRAASGGGQGGSTAPARSANSNARLRYNPATGRLENAN